MSLNLKNGKMIAYITGGYLDGQILHIDTEHNKKQIKKKYDSSEDEDYDSYSDEYESNEDYDSSEDDDLGGYNDESSEELSEDDDFEDDIPNQYFGKIMNLPEGSKFDPIPDVSTREIDYVCGKSGSGKSTTVGKKALNYKRLNPDKPIYIFSMIDKDPAIDMLGGKRIKIDNNLVDNPIDIQNEIHDGALIIFDDVNPDTIVDKKLVKAIEVLKLKILEYGRKNNIYLIVSSHLISPNDKKFGRVILNELTNLVVYPHGGSLGQQVYVLNKHLGYTKNEAIKYMKLPSHWIQFSNSYPSYILTETQCIIP